MKVVVDDVYVEDIEAFLKAVRGQEAVTNGLPQLESPLPDRVVNMPNKLDAVKFCRDTLTACGVDCSLIQAKRFVECIYDIASVPRSQS